MKTIIACTDFSDSSKNAVFFAASLAVDLNYGLNVISTYLMPISTSYDVSISSITSKDLEDSIELSLDKLKEELVAKFPQLKTNYLMFYGNTEDVIEEKIEELNGELVITGLSGKGAVESFLMGSTTKALINIGKFPVMAIPPNVNYSKPSKIALGVSTQQASDLRELFFLGKLINELSSKLMIVSVVKNLEELNTSNAITGLEVNRIMYNVDHTFHFPENENPVEELSKFCKEFSVDWLVLLPHHHSILERVFSKSTTQKVLENVKIPVLCIPDN
jgi:nucleotide-binding universal stress UspA family protein